MKLERGMTAWVSGAGSGIGRGLCLDLARRGLRVGAADISLEAAEATAALIRDQGGTAHAVRVDVSEHGATDAAADQVESALGPVRLVCNNAGVAMHGVPLHQITDADWDWVIGVNIHGVIHGIGCFVPRMLDRGGPGHVLNTASIGGFQVNPDFVTAAYSATKYAVVGLSEGLRNELQGSAVGVSILAPAAVATSIHLSARARPDRMGGAGTREQNHFLGDLIRDGASPDDIGRMALEAVEQDRFYIFTHPETQPWLDRRHQAIRAGFDAARAAARSPEVTS